MKHTCTECGNVDEIDNAAELPYDQVEGFVREGIILRKRIFRVHKSGESFYIASVPEYKTCDTAASARHLANIIGTGATPEEAARNCRTKLHIQLDTKDF